MLRNLYNMELAIYTCIFGQCTDELKQLPDLSKGVEAYAFMDTEEERVSPTGWRIRPPLFLDEPPQLRSRHHKLLSHEVFPDAKLTMWIDGSLTPAHDPMQMIEFYLENQNLITYRHCERNCVYQETEACIRMKKGNLEKIRAQAQRYRQENYPYNNGLAETCVMIRVNEPEVNEFNEAWWEELRNASWRDQISFPYVAWKQRLLWGTFPGMAWQTEDFNWVSHWK